jgi:hypothetical protein
MKVQPFRFESCTHSQLKLTLGTRSVFRLMIVISPQILPCIIFKKDLLPRRIKGDLGGEVDAVLDVQSRRSPFEGGV